MPKVACRTGYEGKHNSNFHFHSKYGVTYKINTYDITDICIVRIHSGYELYGTTYYASTNNGGVNQNSITTRFCGCERSHRMETRFKLYDVSVCG